MEASAVNPINGGFNPLSAGGASNLYRTHLTSKKVQQAS